MADRAHAQVLEIVGGQAPQDALVDIVVAKILQEGDGPVTAHLDLAERGLIEQPRALARAEMLDADGRRPVVSRPA